MSRRFGRNQRRALRAELAAERALRLFGCAVAPLATPRVEAWGVLSWSLSIEDEGRQVERRASVLVENGTLVVRAYHAAGPVSFQGGLYMIADIAYPERSGGGSFGSTFWRGGPDAFVVNLRGIVR